MARNKIEHLRDHLFETIEMLKDGDMDLDKARTIAEVAQVIINGIYDRKKELFISVLLHRVAVWLRFFSPTLFHYLMLKRAQSKSKSKYV